MSSSKQFEIACREKDTNSSNLNQIFSNYGCNTLEAKVPIVNTNVAERLKNATYEQQTLDTLALKNESATNAVEGRMTRTRDRPLHLVNVGREVLIAAGKQREKSPVERSDLDDDLDSFMKETARIREVKEKAREQRQSTSTQFRLPDFSRRFED